MMTRRQQLDLSFRLYRLHLRCRPYYMIAQFVAAMFVPALVACGGN